MKAEAFVVLDWVAKEEVDSEAPAPALPLPLVPVLDAKFAPFSEVAAKELVAPAATLAITPMPLTVTSLLLVRVTLEAAFEAAAL